ncbi:protein of unknown function [Catalinimonas alkaloidigena]|uniref:DUF3127 domain-containing protein n=1 Tax=Catalinimonas alkaloidigena TaxID=1075417 RepID=A0A1G9F245_9BACT|nr:DUF3127 domain-containing protein [Catalinimonas alkaloidigena]SDK82381.1 protein of unknown function [Catalinimonas alkaloidigena]
MSLEINGKVVEVMQPVSGNGRNGTWTKQEFVIETQGQYPKKVCFTSWGDRTDVVKNLSPGQDVTVSFDPESREYNGRWYTDLKAWKIEQGGGGRGPMDNPGAAAGEDLPSYELPSGGDAGTDDLPF